MKKSLLRKIESRIYAEGRRAALAGTSISANPYYFPPANSNAKSDSMPKSLEHKRKLWLNGFDAGRRECDASKT